MKKRIAINGFGRIGRLTFRSLLENDLVEVVAVNDLTDIPTLVHLLKHDTAHRNFDKQVISGIDHFQIESQKVMCYGIKEAHLLPWKDLNVDIVLECTGINLTMEACSAHLSAGAKKVIMSAPPKDSSVNTYVIGVNEKNIRQDENVISNASCTTNCLAPLIKIIDEKYGIEFASMNTIHAYTQDQRLQDAPHKDLRRARAAAMNIIPTSTGAAKAVEQVYSNIKGKLFASSYRVPVITGSLIELLCVLKTELTREEFNDYIFQLTQTTHSKIIEYSDEPLVSTDIIGNPNSSIFDSALTESKGNKLKITAWYDNEAGYSNRLADMCVLMASKF
ncbi:MAG: type I glyceraldehyde-3-phosphate dehydrogenase [Saprospiraceae bacterium]|nr:type I glyceraldehyde-3-phosphate dehydrogenase [Saprospiraceae bacterium]